MPKEYTFHQSQTGQFDLCPERGRALYFEEVEDFGNDSGLHGTCMHTSIEGSLKSKLSTGYGLPYDDMVELYMAELNTGLGDETIQWIRHTPEQLQDRGMKDIRIYQREIEPLVDPMVLEYKFSDKTSERQGVAPPDAPAVLLYEDDEYRIKIAGAIDCVDTNGVIWDWKTATRSYQGWEKQRWAAQPTFYTYAWQQIGQGAIPSEPWQFRYAVILKNGEVQHLLVERTQEHVEWLKFKLLKLVRSLEASPEGLPLNDNGWWCAPEWCPAWNVCKGAHHGGDDWKKVRKL